MRASDDGEPTHSAGAPILGQIQSFGLTHTAVAVVRYFGGTKLGVGGLIKAYKTAAQLSLEACQFKEEVILVDVQLQFKYADIGLVMTWLKQGAFEIIDQTLDQLCVISFKLSKNMIPEALAFWQGHKEIKIIVLQDRRPETEVGIKSFRRHKVNPPNQDKILWRLLNIVVQGKFYPIFYRQTQG